MPIGKNAIKRVTKNGYSNVKTEAPDMENSVIATPQEPVIPTKKAEPVKKAEPKKEAKKCVKKPAPKKSLEKEPDLSPVNTAKRVTKKSTKNEDIKENGFVNIGKELPIHLL